MIKKPLITLFIVFSVSLCNAQFYKSILPSPEFTNALEKIVVDFRVNFQTIQGDTLENHPDIQSFTSTVKLPGASECVIYHYNSKVDTTATWQGLMYRGDDYKEAARTYQNVFRLVKKSRIKWIDKSMISFAGELSEPSEDMRFAMSSLYPDLEDPRYKNFLAEIELVSTYSGWEVHLNLETKKPDREGSLPGY